VKANWIAQKRQRLATASDQLDYSIAATGDYDEQTATTHSEIESYGVTSGTTTCRDSDKEL